MGDERVDVDGFVLDELWARSPEPVFEPVLVTPSRGLTQRILCERKARGSRAISDVEPLDCGAHLDDFATELVAEEPAIAGRQSVPNCRVRAQLLALVKLALRDGQLDAIDRNEHLRRTRLGSGDVLGARFAEVVTDDGFHGGP